MSSTLIPANGNFSMVFLSIELAVAFSRVHILLFVVGNPRAKIEALPTDAVRLTHKLENIVVAVIRHFHDGT